MSTPLLVNRAGASPFTSECSYDYNKPLNAFPDAIYRIIPHLKALMPSGNPPIEVVSATYGLGLPDEGAFYDAYTKERKLHIGGKTGQMPPGGHIRANRAKARAWLLDGIDVQWNKRFVSYEQGEDGVVVVTFEDGSKAEGAVLVGADGVQSRGVSSFERYSMTGH